MNLRPPIRAVTALEIAIVAAVLALLAFLGIRYYANGYLVRKRVQQTQADLRAMAAAITARFNDNSVWPLAREYLRSPEFLTTDVRNGWRDYEEIVKILDFGVRDLDAENEPYLRAFWPRCVTTPVAYLARIPIDPFRRDGDRSYGYMVYRRPGWDGYGIVPFILVGCGPDGDRDIPLDEYGRQTARDEKSPYDWRGYHGFPKPLVTYLYDPTNGLRSHGDILFVYNLGLKP